MEIDATDAEADPVGLSVAVRTEPVRGLQRVMVRTMTAATGVPHLGLGEEVLVDKLVGLVQELKRRAERMDTGTATPYLSLTPFFIKAASLALLEYPILNSILSDDCEHIHFHAEHNFGLAVDTAGGLAVPQIKRVEELSVAEISDELRRLKECAKTGKFDKRDMEGTTTFTLSNVGSIGGTYASPVIPRPQVAIAALGRVRITPRFDAAGKLYPASVLHVSLSCDHRIIDGGTAARFCNAFRDYLENPECMLLHLK